MDIGIIGCGPMGSAMGDLWAGQGHRVCFSYSRHPARPVDLARCIGANARAGTPIEAAQFGQVVALAVPWNLTAEILPQLRPFLTNKIVLSCVVPWNADRSGLVLGAATSAAEEIAARLPEAFLVEALPMLAEAFPTPSRRFGSTRPALFYCGDHPGAKARMGELWGELEVELIDTGPLWSARFLEPMAALLWHMGVGLGVGTDIGLKLLRATYEGERTGER